MLLDKSKHSSTGAAILVTIRSVGTIAYQRTPHQDAGSPAPGTKAHRASTGAPEISVRLA